MLGVVLFAHAWHQLGTTEAKTTAIIAAAVAIGLGALAVFNPPSLITKASSPAIMTFVLLGVVYATALAGIGLWGFDPKALGYYSAFVAVSMIIFAVYFFVGDVTAAKVISTAGGIVSIILVVLFALLFLTLGLAMKGLQTITAWVFLVGSVVIALIGYGAFLHVLDLTK